MKFIIYEKEVLPCFLYLIQIFGIGLNVSEKMVGTSPHVPIHPVVPAVLNSAKFCCKSKTEYPIATTTQKKG